MKRILCLFVIAAFSSLTFAVDQYPIIALSDRTEAQFLDTFGSLPLVVSNNIHIKVNAGVKVGGDEYIVEGDRVKIMVLYLGDIREIELVGVFIDGNHDPLVALTIPGPSYFASSESQFDHGSYFMFTGKADDYCDGHYRLIVAMKHDRKVLVNSLPFRTIVADCGSG